MTQIARVFAAFVAGSRTTPEVSAITGLPVKHCSAHARELVTRGRLRDCGPVYSALGEGRPCRWYEPGRGEVGGTESGRTGSKAIMRGKLAYS